MNIGGDEKQIHNFYAKTEYSLYYKNLPFYFKARTDIRKST